MFKKKWSSVYFAVLRNNIKYEDDLKNEDILKNKDKTTLPEQNCWGLLSLTDTAQLTQNRKCYQLFDVMREMYVALAKDN